MNSSSRYLRNRWNGLACGCIYGFFQLLGTLPLRAGRGLGLGLGRLAFVMTGRYRRIAIQNLAHAYPKMGSEERKKLACKIFENLGMVLFEVAWSLRLNPRRFHRFFQVEGLGHLRNAHGKGKGVLVLTAHFGNWELLSVISAMIGYPLGVVYRPLDFKPLDRFITDYRSRFGGELIPKKKTFRRVLRFLYQGKLVVLLMDQNVAWREGVFAPFFGHPACTNKGMALLELKTEAPIVPAFLIRRADGFTGRFLPEIPLIRTGDKTKDLEANTEQYNRVIESMVRAYPEQWFWVHRRWNTKPFYPWPREA
ncbi:MAG: lysophospholipid acyltransferase family protein [Thermodesulfobacteriota bacterium]